MQRELDLSLIHILTKFSNAVRGSRELASLIELCRIKVVRIISVHDKIDTKNISFPDTKVSDVIEMFGSLPEECAALRNASSHIVQLQQDIIAVSYTHLLPTAKL